MNPYAGDCKLATYGWYSAFETVEQGVYANVEQYLRRYSGYSAETILRKWANSSNPQYYEALRYCYQGY